MEKFAGQQLICRACLKIVENKTQSFGFIEDHTGNLKDMIMCCVPEMDIYVSSNPIMCLPCIQLLVTVYNFKTRCLNTETIIRSYIQRNSLTEYNHVNLSCVIEELIKLNNYFRNVEQKRIEAERLHNMEGHPYHPNGVPYAVPHCVPVNNFVFSGNHGNPAYQPVPLNHENIQHVMRHENVSNMEGVIDNPFIQQHHQIPEPQTTLQDYLIQPDQIGNLLLMEKDPYRKSETSQNEQILENQNVQNDKNITENPAKTDVSDGKMDTGCSNRVNESSDNLEGTKENGEKSSRSEEKSKDCNKIATSVENNNNSPVSKDDLPEKRPRLIIKICKNKITVPSVKNEDSNEKENKEMDTTQTQAQVVHKAEIPLPVTGPFDTHQPEDNSEQQLYECPSCTFITTHLDYYIAHKKDCFGAEQLKCPHCPHVTNRQNALKKHINTMHTRMVWYTCDYCNYRSTDPSCLRRHKRNVHPDQLGSDFTCQVCTYRCTSEYHLKKHMQKHDGNSLLRCQFCSYTSMDRSNFRKHIFIHNPKPHHCEFCDYKCVSPYQMKQHLKRLHNGVGMEDVDCRSEVSISKVVQDIRAARQEANIYTDHQTE